MEARYGFKEGLKDGIPIGLGYLSVSFTFGILSVMAGLYPWEAVLISMLNVTSAGQLSGMTVMSTAGGYIELLISQFTINIRYSFMSISLTQKLSERFKGVWRFLAGFMITDEIFAVAVTRPVVRRSYFFGLCIVPYIGWTLGTLIGAVLGDVLPLSVMSALGIAIYAMFVAIVVPEMRHGLPVIGTVFIAMALSCLFYYVPVLSRVPSGITVSICAIVAALVMAIVKPLPETDEESSDTGAAD